MISLPQNFTFIRPFLRCRALGQCCSQGRVLGQCCSYATQPSKQFPKNVNPERIRNIGIIAHIDAGKTTTTERMLFYSGSSQHLGDVDDGDTVTDYMEQERNRGITITSAAVTFFWNQHRVNLIDTPGHVDFTLEVERSLRILDGAVTVIDASAGVEAQTITVWRQADRFKIPRLVFINKMDKNGADFFQSIQSVASKLSVNAVPLQIPIGKERDFKGVIDLIQLNQIVWDIDTDEHGRVFKTTKLTESNRLYSEALKWRRKLVESLADTDETIADCVLNDKDDRLIPEITLVKAVRNAALNRDLVPVICGSALKNKGVQLLLDSVVFYLPNPLEREFEFMQFYKTALCALAFKVVHHKQRGPIVFLRLYNGQIHSSDTVYNVNQNCSEKVTRLLEVFADDFRDVSVLSAGNIAAVSGLKQTITGDTITSSLSAANSAKKEYSKTTGEDDTSPVLAGLDIPDPVFFCSVEPPTMALQKTLDHALECLCREDPSLRVHIDSDTGQQILSGMGELHLEIIKDRILKEYGVDVYMGELQIAYRESISTSAEGVVTLDKVLGGQKHLVNMCILVEPSDVPTQKTIDIHLKPESQLDTKRIPRLVLQAINSGLVTALSRGPLLGYPLVNIRITLRDLTVKYGTSAAMVTAATVQCIQSAIHNAQPYLLEPYMNLQVDTYEDYQSAVMADLSGRRCHINDIQCSNEMRTVHASVPLSELLGYSTTLRTLSSGMASVNMELSHYQQMNEIAQKQAIQKVTGFYPVQETKQKKVED